MQAERRSQFYRAIDATSTGPAAPLCTSATPIADLNGCTQSRAVDVFGLPYDTDSIMHYKYRE